jgi:hypothetical protein
MIISGYKYDSIAEAETAIQQCNVYYNIPAEPGDVTQDWAGYQTAVFDNPVFYYIIANDTLVPVLGQPSDFEVTSDY